MILLAAGYCISKEEIWVILACQFHPAAGNSFEFPGGHYDGTTKETACKEVQEETPFEVCEQKFESPPSICSPGCSNETVTLTVVEAIPKKGITPREGIVTGPVNFDPGEYVETFYSLRKAL